MRVWVRKGPTRNFGAWGTPRSGLAPIAEGGYWAL
jgi:hypothetical protein